MATFDFWAWVSRIDPNQAPFMFLVMSFSFFVCWFLTTKIWPWYTKEYLPAKQRQEALRAEADVHLEQDRTTVMATLRDAVVSLKEITGQQLALFQQHAQDSADANKDMQGKQDVILSQIAMIVPRVVIQDPPK